MGYEDKTVVLVTPETSPLYVTHVLADQALGGGVWAVDTETTGLDPLIDKLVCITIATPDHAFVFPTEILQLHSYRTIRKALDLGDVQKMCHYAPFDMGFLSKHMSINMKNVWCTKKQAKRAGYANTGLKNLCEKVLALSLDKAVATTFKADETLSEAQLHYTALDAWVLFDLRVRLGDHDGLITEQDAMPMFSYIDGTGPWPSRDGYGL